MEIRSTLKIPMDTRNGGIIAKMEKRSTIKIPMEMRNGGITTRTEKRSTLKIPMDMNSGWNMTKMEIRSTLKIPMEMKSTIDVIIIKESHLAFFYHNNINSTLHFHWSLYSRSDFHSRHIQFCCFP